VSYTGYEIVVLPATINVAEGGEAVTLAAYLSDGNGDVVEGVGVKVNFFDPANGTLSAYNGTTDTNGRFIFTYTAPADLKNAAAFDINVTIADDSNGSRYAASHVTFPDIGSFNLRVIPEQFDVSDTTTPQTIDVYLENNATPAVGYALRVGYFDQKNGTMDTYSGITDANGHVAFVYSPPSTLIGASSFEMDISMQADRSNYVTVDVNMTANDYSNYRIDADDNLTITAAGQAKEISVVLYTDNNGTLSPAVGKTVRAGFITPMYGKLAAYSATTDGSGTATFDYTAPDRIQNLSDFNLSFYFDENRSIRDDMNLSFDSTTESKVSYLYVVPSEVTITSAGEEKNITIVTVNANNVGVTSTVQIEQPIKDSTNYGTLSETLVTTDANGVATVLYTAPDAISTLDERNLTVTEQSENITSRLSIQFKQSSDTNGTPYEIAVTTPDSLSIEDNDQITIVIHELDNANNVIEDDWVNEVNVTSLFSNVMTFADGNATRTYSGEGTKAYKVYTNTLAGVAVIEISASIFNGEINTTISEQITVSVLAGPVRAMSLNYIGSSTDENSSLFQNLYTLHAVDRYNNPAKEGVSISPTLINGWKVEKTNDIVADRTGEINGTSPAKLTDNTVDFYTNGVQAAVDRLIVLPNSINYDQNYTGGWSIETVDNNHTLSLADTYYGPDKSNLTYIIGNEKRLVRNAVHVADIKSKTTSYKTNSSGIVQFYATFDPILAAHTVTLAATAYENGIRTGVSYVDNLRWGHYGSSSQIVPSDNADHWVTLTLTIADENDNALEPLVGLTVSAASIDSDVGDCDINTSADNNLTTDDNGNITFAVSTGLIPGSTIEQCTITWSKSNGSIYLEY
ncbi:MAG: hypothetical protein IE917_15475, partial [Betaproteobacteria bacterium]|nr:hypothetical protein [Betaproteobacteria bacterium]